MARIQHLESFLSKVWQERRIGTVHGWCRRPSKLPAIFHVAIQNWAVADFKIKFKFPKTRHRSFRKTKTSRP